MKREMAGVVAILGILGAGAVIWLSRGAAPVTVSAPAPAQALAARPSPAPTRGAVAAEMPLEAPAPLRETGELEVFVHDASGRPRAGARIELKNDLERELEPIGASTDAGGLCVLRAPVGHSYSVVAQAEAFEPVEKAGLAIRASARARLDIELKPGATIYGLVVDEGGQGLVGARLSAWVMDWTGTPAASATTDEKGAFRMGVRPQRHNVTARLPGYSEASVNAWPSESPLKLTLRKGVRLRGVVASRKTGQPVAGARVQGGPREAATTDAKGAFELAVGLKQGRSFLQVSARGFRNLDFDLRGAKPGEERELKLELTPASQVSGTVLDALTHEPVGGASLTLESSQNSWSFGPSDERPPAALASSDVEGRFSLDMTEAQARLRVSAEGYAPLARLLRLELDHDMPGLLLEMSPAATLEGRVLSPDGAPVADAEVRLAWAGNGFEATPSTRSGADGRYRLSSVSGGRAYGLGASHAGFAPSGLERVWVEPGASIKGLDLKLLPGSGVAGRVLFEDGAPASGALVSAAPQDSSFLDSPLASLGHRQASGVAAEDGSFRLEGLEAGAYRLAAGGPAVDSSSAPAKVKLSAGRITEGVELRVGRGVQIRGVLVDKQDRPVPEAWIRSEPLDERQGQRQGWSTNDPGSSVTDEEGRFQLSSLRPGAYQLGVQIWSLMLRESFQAKAPDENVRLVLKADRGGSIEGRVVRASDGRPVPEFEAMAAPARTRGGVNIILGRQSGLGFFLEPEGRFRIEGLPAQVYTLVVRAPGYAEARVEGLRLEEGQAMQDVAVELRAGASVAGLVLDEKGAPVGGAQARLLDENSARMAQWRSLDDFLPSAWTRSDGSFSIEEAAAGAYTLQVSQPGYVPASLKLELREGEAREGLELRLSQGWRVRGVVLRGAGREPVAGALLDVDTPPNPWGGERRLATSAGDGSFEIQRVEAGQHQIYARAPDSQLIASKVVDVAADVDDLELTLGEGASVKGRVLDAGGNPVPQVNVWLWSEEAWQDAESDAQGRFEFSRLAAGAYTLQASVFTGGIQRNVSKNVALEEGKTLDVLLQPDEGHAIRGVVRRKDGGSVERYQLIATRQDDSLSWSDRQVGFFKLPASGAYEIPGLRPDAYQLRVRAPDVYASGITLLTRAVRMAEEDLTLDLEVPPPGRIDGVVSSGGRPLAGASLSMRLTSAGSTVFQALGVTDQAGYFLLEEMPAAAFDLRAEKDGYESRTTSVELSEGASLRKDFELEEQAGLSGSLRDASGRLLGDGVLWICTPDGQTLKSVPVVHDEEGVFHVSGLPPGDLFVTALAPGWAPSTRRVRIPESARADFALTPGGGLLLRTLDAQGRPRAAQTVEVKLLVAGVALPLPAGMPGRPWQSTTDAAGRLELRLLEPGAYQARIPGEPGTAAEASVELGQTSELTLQPAP